MKNLKGFLLVVGLLFVVLAPVMAQDDDEDRLLIINKEGEVKLLEDGWRLSNEKEREAYYTGKETPVGDYEFMSKRVGFWNYCLTKTYSQVNVREGNKIHTTGKVMTVENQVFAYHVFFSIIAIIMALIGNFIFYASCKKIFDAFAISAFVVIPIIVVVVVAMVTSAVFALAFPSALFTFVAIAFISVMPTVLTDVSSREKKRYFIYHMFFYISMLIVIFL